ncbi:hypothetical protein PVAP13_5KG770450 [Panicum virgatum]|uniref:Uncharacterized protein n=1 Tax=Panicum virgatum TaxID=38727 RepID=A0A8T0SZ95_PANVG|nr:hypothetical protein PVAP13_5KG770450 [Panicum virgatum]
MWREKPTAPVGAFRAAPAAHRRRVRPRRCSPRCRCGAARRPAAAPFGCRSRRPPRSLPSEAVGCHSRRPPCRAAAPTRCRRGAARTLPPRATAGPSSRTAAGLLLARDAVAAPPALGLRARPPAPAPARPPGSCSREMPARRRPHAASARGRGPPLPQVRRAAAPTGRSSREMPAQHGPPAASARDAGAARPTRRLRAPGSGVAARWRGRRGGRQGEEERRFLCIILQKKNPQ